MLTINIPAGRAPTTTYARFRYNTSCALSYDSLAMNVEVEDYRIAIYPEDWVISVTDLIHMIVVSISLGQVLLAVEDYTLMPEDFLGV